MSVVSVGKSTIFSSTGDFHHRCNMKESFRIRVMLRIRSKKKALPRLE
jgi:hypothetical protein